MNRESERYQYLTMIIGSGVAGVIVYFVLSYLLIPDRVTISLTAAISILIFGLAKYYSSLRTDTTDIPSEFSTARNSQMDATNTKDHEKEKSDVSSILFVTIFVVLLIISYFGNNQDLRIFTSWSDIGVIGIIQLCAAIMLSFFIPGLAIVLILDKKYKVDSILKILFAYLLSMLITGVTAYILALSFDIPVSQSKDLLIGIYLVILISFVIFCTPYRSIFASKFQTQNNSFLLVSKEIHRFKKHVRSRASELIVFGSLFMLTIVSTYLLYGGITFGDQWYHQGRALLFMSGSIREAALFGGDNYYPPLQSALLAALTNLSGLPLVNTYASIAFLNAMPMFAFYYFFSTWVPVALRNARLIACSLFILSSGFGWIYLLSITPNDLIISQQSSLNVIGKIADLDIISAINFVIPTAPDFSTALIYIALPAGFILLGMVRTMIHSKFVGIFIVTAITLVGIISHYEFYIFVIIASILPPIFKLKLKSFVYVAFLIAISIVYLLNITTPGNYYTHLDILGIQLLLLTGLFVIITWIIYLSRAHVQKFVRPKLIFPNLRKSYHRNKRFKFMTGAGVVFLVAYVYLLSFTVVSQLSLETIRAHTDESSVPWYLYPMRLGVAGLLGLVFVLSFLFKKFEKEVFVFGIIIIVSLITGPYYDEARFSKYTMMGMIGFASLMIFRILSWRLYNNTIRNTALLGTIIISSGLSIMIFIGYNSLIFQTQDFTNILSRRHFPSMQELQLFEEIRQMSDIDSNRYNILSFPNEYNRRIDGVMQKISSFAGLPHDKLRQSPLTLNASTLDALYRHMAYSDAKYIILPRDSIQTEKTMTEPTRFAIDNFKSIYDDKNYIILEIPLFEPPVSTSTDQVAIAYTKEDFLDSQNVSYKGILQYNNESFNFKAKDESVVIQGDNQTQGRNLFFSKQYNGTTVWSKNIDPMPTINSFEASFRIISEDGNKSNNYVGLKWQEGENDYFTKFTNSGLELYQKLKNNQHYRILINNSEAEKNESIWYRVKMESLDNSINVYVNDVLKIQASKALNSNITEGISRIGLSSYHNNVEFRPIKIWNVSQPSQQFNNKTKYFDYYYPLSLLALSGVSYDVFKGDDLSIFSNDVILVADSPDSDNYTRNKYLDYVRSGGTLIVVNSDNNFNRTFSRLFSVQDNENKVERFTNIASHKDQNLLINVPGMVKSLEIKSSPDVYVTASYQNNNNQTVAPFVIEKSFSDGRIVLINAGAYLNTISNSPKQYFHALSNVSKLLPLDAAKAIQMEDTTLPMKGIIGSMEARGQITLNSSSLALLDEGNYPYVLNAKSIRIFNETNNSPITLNNVLIKGLKLMGNYKVLINLTGTLRLPGAISENNYISMLIPNNFDMTVHLNPERNTNMEIFTHSNGIDPIRINNNSKIEFDDIKARSSLKLVPVLLKSPEIIVNGNTSIRNAFFDGYLFRSGSLNEGMKLDFQGELKTKFGFVDHYYEQTRDASRIKYISYLDFVEMDGSIDQGQELLKLPADIPALSIEEGQNIPLKKILSSPNNIVTLVVLIIATIIGIWLTRRFRPRIIKDN